MPQLEARPGRISGEVVAEITTHSQRQEYLSVPPIIPDEGPGEALLIVTVEVVPGLSLGTPQ